MLTIKEARKILGKTSVNKSDEYIQSVIDQAELFKNIFKLYLRDGLSNKVEHTNRISSI
jgi:hypothetical protein